MFPLGLVKPELKALKDEKLEKLCFKIIHISFKFEFTSIDTDIDMPTSIW